MGKPTGFIDWGRAASHKRETDARLKDFRELALSHPEPETREQAGRCMECGVPFCHQGCPLGNLIPDFNDAVFQGRWEAAYRTLATTNNFPEFTGRLCPAPCESACVLAINQDPVTIEEVEKQIVERAFAEGWVRSRPVMARSGKRVAVVGSGPAGLAAAAQLNQAGHHVTLFERADQLGGLLRYGIPDFKMEKWVIDRRVALMREEGIELVTGADVGGALPYAQLKHEHDAILIATGARRPRELEVSGRELKGVVQAMDFLEAQNRAVAAGEGRSPLNAAGRRVIILGGGDTGSDCLGTALRQGARSVMQVELLPTPPSVRPRDNPWPQWPLVFRTSSSQEEGGARSFGWMTTGLAGTAGKLGALQATQVEARMEKGRMMLVPVPGSETSFDVDLLVLALGFLGPEAAALERELGVVLDGRGNIKVDPQGRTSVEGVYAAGDASRGASLVVWAVSDGREAARSMDSDLTGARSTLPTRGQNLAFGGR